MAVNMEKINYMKSLDLDTKEGFSEYFKNYMYLNEEETEYLFKESCDVLNEYFKNLEATE